ncbi:alpha/beta fold hydrolase [Dyadobacter sp. 22481]|uniref:alpha/beta fold hydrolase n=1 Tax=Dyadobacter sp. 22481 TaxID=3453926 RepID=UPI003F8373E3
MKKLCFLTGLLCLSILAKGQSVPQPIVMGQVDTVYSEVLKEKRPILIYSPSYDSVYFSKPAYPVVYVLDGDAYFASLVTMIQQLSVHNGNTIFPQMVIVGVPNLPGKRNRDLTPSPSTMDPASGGGEAFTTFLEKELIPYVDEHYATAPYRTLIGHSLGGLMVLNTLLKHPSLFNAYVALDPSMSYDHGNLLKQTRQLLRQQSWKQQSLFLGIANTMNADMDTVQVRSDTTAITFHIRSILMLKDNLAQAAANGLRWRYKYYADDDHASIPLIAEYDALRFIFNSNRFPLNQPQNQYLDRAYSVVQLKKNMDAHYGLVSKERGYQVKPPEPLMNQLGYSFLQQKDFERAFFFFETNVQYYPNSFNVYDGMGDYFLAIGKKPQAIDYFKRALKLKNTSEIRDKLQKLSLE